MLPHEFLYLMCNCQPRLNLIIDNHRPEFTNDVSLVYQWEIAKNSQNMKQMKEKNLVVSLHKVSENANQDNGPKQLIQRALLA